MSDFSQQIHNFQRYGTYDYSFDSVGNMTFNSSSVNFNQVFLAFPLQNVSYNNNKIQSFFNVNFEEFVPEQSSSEVSGSEELQSQLDTVQQENISLKSQLDDLILFNQTSGSANASDTLATQQVILELRKALGQGRVDSDFSPDFPYTPILKPNT